MNITQSFVTERDRALLGGDYDTYHAQAVRKIHALRRRLGNATPRSRKFTPKAPVTAENVGQNPEWVQLLLASSERAWAHAMAMKSAQSPENTQKQMQGSTKRQIASRYRRAILFAENLVQVLSDQSVSKATNIDILEAKAYLALLRGGLDFEKTKWQQCIQNYAVARLIYSALATTSKSETYKDLLSATIDPSIRYAAYQLKLPRTTAIQDIAIEKFPSSEQDSRSEIIGIDSHAFIPTSEQTSIRSDGPTNLPKTISWRTRTVNIEDASISQYLGIAQDKELALFTAYGQYTKGDMQARELSSAFDDVINARQDVVDTTKESIDELRAEGVDQGDARVQALQVIRTATNYAVIEWRIGRNRVLCGVDDGLTFEAETQKQSPKPRKDGKSREPKEESSGRKLARLRERVALYDAILQSVDAVKDLPGVIADSDFVDELDGKRAYFRSLKCLAIGRSYAVNGKVVDALALYSRAAETAQLSSKQIKSPEAPTNGLSKFSVTQDQLKSLTTYLTTLTLQYRALADLNTHNSKTTLSSSASVPPLIERMHHAQYEDDVDLTNLVNYPPKLQPVPVKPLFFDLAWNYIQYPGRRQEENGTPQAPESQTKEDKPVKKGWFGFGR